MSKNKKIQNIENQLFEDEKQIENYKDPEKKQLDEQIENSMLRYGEYVNEKRAIPSALDGLKPVQRRALYTFYYDKAIGKKVKLAKISGTCMGNFHPHGDSSINDAIANLVQPWKNNFPLLEGQGNWGSISGDDPAAARYVEVKINNFESNLIFSDINKKDVIPWTNNYDDSFLEPELLPVKYPIHLINGTSGIGYSMSTNIISYNIQEITKMFIYLIENKFWDYEKWNIEEHKDNLLSIVKGPDLPTGTSIYFKEAPENYMFKSSFSFGMRADFDIDEKENQITIKNIPSGITTEKLTDELKFLALDYKTEIKNKKEITVPKEKNEILNLKTSHPAPILNTFELDENGAQIVTKPIIILTFKSGCNLQTELSKILSHTSVDVSETMSNLVITDKGVPDYLSLYQNIRLFLFFRRYVVCKSIESDLNLINEQITLAEGLKLIVNNKEKFLDIVLKTEDLKEDLKINFPSLNEDQINYISEIKISKLTKKEIYTLEEEIKLKLEKKLNLEKTISSNDSIFEYIKEDYQKLLEDKKIKNCERKSNIIENKGKISIEDTIDNIDIILMLMNDETIGYIEKNRFEARNRGSKLKNSKINQSGFDINVKTIYDGKIKDDCFFITNHGRIFKTRLIEFSKKFLNIRNFFKLMDSEYVIKIIKSDNDLNESKNLILISNLMVKNIKLSYFNSISSNSGKYAMKLSEGDILTNVLIHEPSEEEDIIILSEDGKALKFDKNEIKETKSGQTSGVRIINKKFKVLDAFLARKTDQENLDIILISDLGRGKKINLIDIKEKKRNQSPLIIFENNDKNGKLIKGLLINQSEKSEIILISENGDLSVLKIEEDLRSVSRQAKGTIKLINNQNNDKIVYATKNIVEENEGSDFSEEDLDINNEIEQNK